MRDMHYNDNYYAFPLLQTLFYNEDIKYLGGVKLGFIIETKEAEKSWNAFRFANACLTRGHDVKVFLMGEAVECEQIKDEKYTTPKDMKKYLDAEGVLLACGTCIQSRKLEDETVCPISTMNDCVDLVDLADKVVTF